MPEEILLAQEQENRVESASASSSSPLHHCSWLPTSVLKAQHLNCLDATEP